ELRRGHEPLAQRRLDGFYRLQAVANEREGDVLQSPPRRQRVEETRFGKLPVRVSHDRLIENDDADVTCTREARVIVVAGIRIRRTGRVVPAAGIARVARARRPALD